MPPDSNPTDQIVLLPVPISLYPAMVAALQQALAASAEKPSVPATQPTASAAGEPATSANEHIPALEDLGDDHPFGFVERTEYPTVPWTEADIRELYKVVADRPVIVALLDLCASEPGKWFNLGEVASAAGVEYARAKGGMSAFTRTIHAHFNRDNWPTQWKWHKTELRAYYALDEAMSQVWRKVRAQT